MCWILVLLCSSKDPLAFDNHLAEDDKIVCFTLVVFLLSCDSVLCVSLGYHGLVGTCADLESFAREGPTGTSFFLLFLMRGKRIPIALKGVIFSPPAKCL